MGGGDSERQRERDSEKEKLVHISNLTLLLETVPDAQQPVTEHCLYNTGPGLQTRASKLSHPHSFLIKRNGRGDSRSRTNQILF